MGKTQTKQRWYAPVSQLTQFMPPPETYKVKSGVSLRCVRSILVHTSHYSRLEKLTTAVYRLPPEKDYHVLHCYIYIYIARSTYRYAYARQTHINWKKEATKETKKRRKENKIKGRYHLPACLAVVGQLIGKMKQRKKQRKEEKKIR